MDESTLIEMKQTEVLPEPALVAVPADHKDLVLEELLVEEISIDGMCGVY